MYSSGRGECTLNRCYHGVNCLQVAPSIYTDLSTNQGNHGSWNECDIITFCVSGDVCDVTGLSVAWQLRVTSC